MKAPKRDIVLVVWEDSHAMATASWHTEDEVHDWATSFLIYDVGFFLKEDKSNIYIIGGFGDVDEMEYSNTYHRELCIPKGCIKYKRIIKYATPKL